MFKALLQSIFAKKPSSTIETVPVFDLPEGLPTKSDFEVTELTYEEYARFASKERRQKNVPVVYDRRNPTGRTSTRKPEDNA